jgi:hypothetical protein
VQLLKIGERDQNSMSKLEQRDEGARLYDVMLGRRLNRPKLNYDHAGGKLSMNSGGKPCTSKQMGDACEMFIAAEMTLAGVPALKMPDNWPCYDVAAQPTGGGATQRISVKSRTFKRGGGTFVTYKIGDQFDWLAIVLLPGADQKNRRVFIVPRGVADARSKQDGPTAKTSERYWRQDRIADSLSEFEDNYCLSPTGRVG